MAIDYSVYTLKVCTGLKCDVSCTLFLISVRRRGKLRRKTLDLSGKGWSKRDRERKAKRELEEVIGKMESSQGDMPTVGGYWKQYLSKLPDTPWTKTLERHFDNYMQANIGSKLLDKLLPDDIERCIGKQEKQGLRPRTVNTTLEILRPLYGDAIKNRLVPFSPCHGVRVKLPKTKKIVVDASARLKEMYDVIMELFGEDPFYRAIYLFALMGRRKGEILSLKWASVSLEHGYVVLEETKSGEIQKMYLHPQIREALLAFREKGGVWVFPSPVNPGRPISDIRKTTEKIRKRLPYYTMHYSRNVIVSAMAERGSAATSMSGALGHVSAKTIDRYLSLNYLDGSKQAADTITLVTG